MELDDVYGVKIEAAQDLEEELNYKCWYFPDKWQKF